MLSDALLLLMAFLYIFISFCKHHAQISVAFASGTDVLAFVHTYMKGTVDPGVRNFLESTGKDVLRAVWFERVESAIQLYCQALERGLIPCKRLIDFCAPIFIKLVRKANQETSSDILSTSLRQTRTCINIADDLLLRWRTVMVETVCGSFPHPILKPNKRRDAVKALFAARFPEVSYFKSVA